MDSVGGPERALTLGDVQPDELRFGTVREPKLAYLITNSTAGRAGGNPVVSHQPAAPDAALDIRRRVSTTIIWLANDREWHIEMPGEERRGKRPGEPGAHNGVELHTR